ncbi:hypothetical protein KUTeg_016080 [Tegillarca granosa]|uniref:Histidine-specific methyltransferase SAM-dependent domain-containing protein n=1 Tax=Tegillarca granosa TaxID=220873 RepID=A0ABQ9EQ48_TEGGR|nr:hypothetical protein KUTeg_016080 [Tegillarca granosa]
MYGVKPSRCRNIIGFIIRNIPAKDVVESMKTPCVLYDLGSVNKEKTRYFIDTILEKHKSLTYLPNFSTSTQLQELYGDILNVKPLNGDYLNGIITKQMFLTLDVTQNKEEIENAYLPDLTGASLNLNLNAIWRLNREFNSNIDTDRFQLYIRYIENKDEDATSVVELVAKSTMKQRFHIRKRLFKYSTCNTNQLRDKSLRLERYENIETLISGINAELLESDGFDVRIIDVENETSLHSEKNDAFRSENVSLKREIQNLKSVVIRLDRMVASQEEEINDLKSRSMRDNQLIHNFRESDNETF